MGLFSKIFGPAKPEPGLGLDELARRLKTDIPALQQCAIHYQEMRLPKPAGGTRLLHIPADPLKALQRAILHRLLGRLSAHPAAQGFERGKSIASNAAPHVGAAVIIKMDFKDFFTRTTTARVRAFFIGIGWG